jgi:hypothetical protein
MMELHRLEQLERVQKSLVTRIMCYRLLWWKIYRCRIVTQKNFEFCTLVVWGSITATFIECVSLYVAAFPPSIQ